MFSRVFSLLVFVLLAPLTARRVLTRSAIKSSFRCARFMHRVLGGGAVARCKGSGATATHVVLFIDCRRHSPRCASPIFQI
jgi:hypothetical protein